MKKDSYFKNKRQEVSALLPPDYSRVLEIGCGEGKFRENLNAAKEYWGVELVESAAKQAENVLDRVLTGSYQEVEELIPNQYFDLIVCNDVIEHMPDHDWFLQSIQQKLKKGGYVVASIPNVRYIKNLWELLVKKDWKYREQGILDRTHLRFFTRKSMIRTLKENGFIIEQMIGLNPYRPHNPFSWMRYLIMMLVLGSDIRYLQYGFRLKMPE
jgi:2-polyprenyl-3-methyl-5-hydroxy-6-metoxy-1,4-benzoquinol methylase